MKLLQLQKKILSVPSKTLPKLRPLPQIHRMSEHVTIEPEKSKVRSVRFPTKEAPVLNTANNIPPK